MGNPLGRALRVVKLKLRALAHFLTVFQRGQLQPEEDLETGRDSRAPPDPYISLEELTCRPDHNHDRDHDGDIEAPLQHESTATGPQFVAPESLPVDTSRVAGGIDLSTPPPSTLTAGSINLVALIFAAVLQPPKDSPTPLSQIFLTSVCSAMMLAAVALFLDRFLMFPWGAAGPASTPLNLPLCIAFLETMACCFLLVAFFAAALILETDPKYHQPEGSSWTRAGALQLLPPLLVLLLFLSFWWAFRIAVYYSPAAVAAAAAVTGGGGDSSVRPASGSRRVTMNV